MNIIKCSKGHFYDADKFFGCPHCGNGDSHTTSTGNYDGMESGNHTMLIDEEDDIFDMMPSSKVMMPKEAMPSSMKVEPSKKEKKGWGFTGRKEVKEKAPVSQVVAPQVVTPQAVAQKSVTGQGIQSLEKQVEQSVNYQIPYPVQNDDMGKTVGFYENDVADEPVVGWCVCIKGTEYGKSYNLRSGKNHIGRSPAMDVPLLGDCKVSRDKHATVVFEPNRCEFIFLAGDTNGLCYLNDELVLQPVTLKAYDEIVLGESRLLFVPLCGEKFNWKNN